MSLQREKVTAVNNLCALPLKNAESRFAFHGAKAGKKGVVGALRTARLSLTR